MASKQIDRFFRISERGSTVAVEIKAGVVTFLTMSYILLVNPQILGQAGLPVKEVVSATALASVVSSLAVGLVANLPFGMSPGMGLNAYLVFNQVLGNTPYHGNAEAALAGCMVAAAVVAVLASVQALSLVLAVVPNSIKLATVVGMGLLLSFIGCHTSGIVVPDAQTMVAMGNLLQPDCILAILGLCVIAALHFRNVKGSIIIGILLTAVAAWAVHSSWPHAFAAIPKFKIFTLDYTYIFKQPNAAAFSAICAYALVIVFDVGGAMFGLGNLGGLLENGKVPRASLVYLCAAAGTAVGALFGTTPVIIAAESAVGIKEGGRTGLVAVTVAACFAVSTFLAPLLQAIPPVATAPVLVLVGAMMMGESIHIDWSVMPTAVPAFLTIVIQPFTFSIANGIYAGLATWLLLFFLTGTFLDRLHQMASPKQLPVDLHSLEAPLLPHIGPQSNGSVDHLSTNGDVEEHALSRTRSGGSLTNPVGIAGRALYDNLTNTPHFDLSSSFGMLVNTLGSGNLASHSGSRANSLLAESPRREPLSGGSGSHLHG